MWLLLSLLLLVLHLLLLAICRLPRCSSPHSRIHTAGSQAKILHPSLHAATYDFGLHVSNLHSSHIFPFILPRNYTSAPLYPYTARGHASSTPLNLTFGESGLDLSDQYDDSRDKAFPPSSQPLPTELSGSNDCLTTSDMETWHKRPGPVQYFVPGSL